jgi:multicomponent Na+:H+ antiporter subunit B
MMDKQPGLTLIVKTVTRLLVWMIFLYGTYIIFHGHLSPGGGFGGGVILALGLLSILLAYGRDFTLSWLNVRFLKSLEASSIILFLAAGLMGLVLGEVFLLISIEDIFSLWVRLSPAGVVIGLKSACPLSIVFALMGFDLKGRRMILTLCLTLFWSAFAAVTSGPHEIYLGPGIQATST